MKKRIQYMVLIGLLLFTCSCKSKYEGYWCKYKETATIVVLVDDTATEQDKKKLEEKISTLDNLTSTNHYSKEDYAEELNANASELDIYETYVLLFDSMDAIGTYINEISALSGVKEAIQSNAKTNISLYHIGKNGKYTYTNSDEALDSDLINGKYKIKKGVITFTEEQTKKTTLLYIKDNHLCGNADCTEIYAESNSSCDSMQE